MEENNAQGLAAALMLTADNLIDCLENYKKHNSDFTYNLMVDPSEPKWTIISNRETSYSQNTEQLERSKNGERLALQVVLVRILTHLA